MAIKPNMMQAQLQAQTGMGRKGGNASMASTAISPDTGKKFAGMENAILRKLKPNPTAVAAGKKTRQFKKDSGENFGQT